MRFSLGIKIAAGFAAALLVLGAVGLTSYLSTTNLLENAQGVSHSHEGLERLERVLSLVKDAETETRGFVLTGSEQYLNHYRSAFTDLAEDLKVLRRLTSDNPAQQRRLDRLE